ncbi:MAG: hypothetical protein KDI82_03585 [Gammaproteobacteria bacterium]|nr:hypothetical protein [Gammaproteobacteria bacterium]
MLEALNEIERLLRSHGHTYHANLAGIAAVLSVKDPIAACRAINSDDWWQGADSLAALDLGLSGGFTSQARQDAHALRLALIDVFSTLLAHGECNEAGEIVVSQFRKWLESHM